MTKYVVNSGNVRGNVEKARRYLAEALKGLGDKPRILFCFFANAREDWEEKYENYTNDLANYLPKEITPTFDMAMPSNFIEQIHDTDIIWICGGDDHLLLYWLRQFDLPKIWEDKTIATSSASSNAVSTHFWTCDWRECLDGLGLVPIKFISHYKSNYGDNDLRGPIDWEKAKQELAGYGNKSLPIYTLEEGTFEVFNV